MSIEVTLPFFLQVSCLLKKPIGVAALTEFFRQNPPLETNPGKWTNTITTMARQKAVCWQKLATLVFMLETERTRPLTLIDTTDRISSLIPFYRSFVAECGSFLTQQLLHYYPDQPLLTIDFRSFWPIEGLRQGFLRLAIILMHYNCTRMAECYQYLLDGTITVPGPLARSFASGPPPTFTHVVSLSADYPWLDLQVKLDRIVQTIAANGRIVCRVGNWSKHRLLRLLALVRRFCGRYRKKVTVEMVVSLWHTAVCELLTLPCLLHILIPDHFITQLHNNGSFTLFAPSLPEEMIPVMQGQPSIPQQTVHASDLWQNLADASERGGMSFWSTKRLGDATPTSLQVLQSCRQVDPLVVSVESCYVTEEKRFDFERWQNIMKTVAVSGHPGGVIIRGLADLTTLTTFHSWYFQILETAVYCMWPHSEPTTDIPLIAQHWPEIYRDGRIGRQRWRLRVHVEGWRRVLLGTDWQTPTTPLFCSFPCQTFRKLIKAPDKKAAFFEAYKQNQLVLN